jgi:hypothetical protein
LSPGGATTLDFHNQTFILEWCQSDEDSNGVNMSTEIRHFVLTQNGEIREFSSEEAALIAAGSNRLPEYAERRMRYLQVSWDDEASPEMKIQTAGAAIRFDADGRLSEAAPPGDEEKLSRFEHDTCVQWALRDIAIASPLVFH